MKNLLADDKVVYDRYTGLMWQQSESPERMYRIKAPEYIVKLNVEKFAGFDDWRLPTLEEAMSLMKPIRYNSLHIASYFDEQQYGIWTSDYYDDRGGASRDFLFWGVRFSDGYWIITDYGAKHKVRAVRSTQSD